MVRSNKKVKIGFSLLLTMILVLSSFTSLAYAENKMPKIIINIANNESEEESSNKIEKELIQAFLENDYVGTIIYLKEQVDVERVVKTNINSMDNDITPYKKEVLSKYAAANALQDVAEDTQKNILKYLREEEERGNVKEIKDFYVVNAIYAEATKEVIQSISKMNEVKMIYLDKKIEIDKPILKENTAIDENYDNVEWNIEKIGAPDVWDMGINGTGVVVGIIDSGAEWFHEALKLKWRGYNPDDEYNPNIEGNWYDAVAGRERPYDMPSNPHGTHVLGTILGQDPNGRNKIGVAPGAKWIAAKAFTEEGGKDSWLLDAGQWMMAPGGDPLLAPDIINNSWGGSSGLNEWYRQMVKNWRDVGILPVFSAGNEKNKLSEPGSISSPANYPESFAVAAVDKNNLRADFSRQGPSPYGEIIKPEISAPGVNIRSSVLEHGYKGGWSGTSMAAPHISGTAALLLSANRSLTADEIENLIINTATPLRDSQYNESPNYGYGYGLVNAFEAVSSILSGKGTITGQVLREGEDIESPIIIHEPVTKSIVDMDIYIEANILDNVSVVEANLYVKNDENWIPLRMEKRSGSHKDSIFVATIPKEYAILPGFFYKMEAIDFSGNIGTTEEYYVKITKGICPDEYETDFSSYPAGWELIGDWEWGEPVDEPAPYIGEKLVGTNLAGDYSSSTESMLITPPIDLSDNTLEEATFRLNHWYDIELNYDKASVLISSDGKQTWEPAGIEFTGSDKVWRGLVINLNEHIGKEEPVYIAFKLTSDRVTQYRGWYIDNVRLIGKDIEAPNSPNGLEARLSPSGVVLNWEESIDDGDVAGYKIYRSSVARGEYIYLGQSSTTNFIDATVMGNEPYYYSISAYDFSGNESELSEEISIGTNDINILYFSNFEENDGGWISGGDKNSWESGIPKSGPFEAFTGKNVWATNLSGNYKNGSRCWIESPEINIPSEGVSYLSFHHWYKFERSGSADRGEVLVSKDNGVTWTNITPEPKYYGGQPCIWMQEIISLNDFIGEKIKIRFLLTTDLSMWFEGWYIDNVGVGTFPEEQNFKTVNYDRLNQKIEHEINDVKFIDDIENLENNIVGLPIDATVFIKETDRSVKADPTEGKYTLVHEATKEGQEWTLCAESYGYYPVQEKVQLLNGDIITKDFLLQPMPKGSIKGKIIDESSREPVSGVKIRVKEDFHIQPVISDENGEFLIEDAYVGDYTLRISSIQFYGKEVPIKVFPDQENYIEIELNRFVGYPEEIAYDDGIGETALVINPSGGGLAVRMTPNELCKVKGTNIYFWDDSWPSPGGDEIGIGIISSDENGNPDKLVGEPLFVKIERGKWNYIDLSDMDFSTDRDFYITTVQKTNGNYSPGVGLDMNGPKEGRSYIYYDNELQPLGPGHGNLMIRADILYLMGIPQITNLPKMSYINEDILTVEGVVNRESKLRVYKNGTKIKEIHTTNKQFSEVINIDEGENRIYVTAMIDGIETKPSEEVLVIKDKVKPMLNVVKPEDGEKSHIETIDVAGNATDEHLDQVKVNGNIVEVAKNGDFSTKVILESGQNIIEIIAKDLAGNETRVQRTVHAKFEGPIISNVKPDEDIILKSGDKVDISFESEPEGTASFRILLPGINQHVENIDENMIEIEEGYYKGSWEVPQDFKLNNALIEVTFLNKYGNKATEIAQGKITVETDEDPTVPEPEVPELTNIQPSTDQELEAGDKLVVSFNAPEDGEGYFTLRLPLGLSAIEKGIKMVEVEPGLYKGEWTVPEGLMANNLIIDIMFTSKDGISALESAEGKVSIVEKEDPIEPEPMVNLPANTVIVGEEAFDIRYLNSNGDAQRKLINWNNEGNEVYIKLSEERIVNIQGQVVSMDELPDELTYYDVDGNTTIYVK